MAESRCPHCDDVVGPKAAREQRCDRCGRELSDRAPGRTDRSWVAPQAVAEPEPAAPEYADLPIDAEPHLPFNKLWLCLGLIFSGAVVIVVCAATGNVLAVVIGCGLGATAVLVGGILLAVELTVMRGVRRDLLALQKGDHLVRWEYEPGEWQRFIEAEWARGRWWGLLVVAGFLGTLVPLLCIPLGDTEDARWGLGTGAAVGACLLAIGGTFFGQHVYRYRRGRRLIGVAYFGREMVCFAGGYRIWNRAGLHLMSVRVDTGSSPAVLEVEVGYGDNSNVLRVPIPRGRLGEAHDVARQLLTGE